MTLYNISNNFFLISGAVGSTNMNLHSSRSHAIFTVTVECSEKYPDGKQHVRVGKLHLVDLAVSMTRPHAIFTVTVECSEKYRKQYVKSGNYIW